MRQTSLLDIKYIIPEDFMCLLTLSQSNRIFNLTLNAMDTGCSIHSLICRNGMKRLKRCTHCRNPFRNPSLCSTFSSRAFGSSSVVLKQSRQRHQERILDFVEDAQWHIWSREWGGKTHEKDVLFCHLPMEMNANAILLHERKAIEKLKLRVFVWWYFQFHPTHINKQQISYCCHFGCITRESQHQYS